MPKDWGAFFLHFPTGGNWDLPSSGWHLDGDQRRRALRRHEPHQRIAPARAQVVRGARAGTRCTQLRQSLQRHPYLRDLSTPGDPAARIARFHDRVEEVDGIPLQEVENVAAAGNVILMHSLLLHVVPAALVGKQLSAEYECPGAVLAQRTGKITILSGLVDTTRRAR